MASTYEKIATTTLGSAAASTTFSSISSSYTDLVLICAAGQSPDSTLELTFNSDSGNNYSRTIMYGTGSTAVSARGSNNPAIYISAGSSVGTNINIINIMNYANTTTYKTIVGRTNDTSSVTVATVGLWRNTNAINTIKLTGSNGNILSGSTFTLYGIKAA